SRSRTSYQLHLLFFKHTATTQIYTLSLHDALPIYPTGKWFRYSFQVSDVLFNDYPKMGVWPDGYYLTFNMIRPHLRVVVEQHVRSEEHTSELQSRGHLVCRLLLEKKKTMNTLVYHP